MLSDLIKEHMIRPRNQGIIPGAHGMGEVVGPVCGDQVVVYIEITGGRISKASFTTHGCWAALAMGSYITDLTVGLTPQEALALDGQDLAREKAELPEDKWPCGRLVSQALHRAVRDWQGRQRLKK